MGLCKPVGILVTCTILYVVEISSRPLYPYLVVAPTERGPVLSPACLGVSRRRPRQVSSLAVTLINQPWWVADSQVVRMS